jgi:hypothetical protein
MRNDRLSFSIRLFFPTLGQRDRLGYPSALKYSQLLGPRRFVLFSPYNDHKHVHKIMIYLFQKEDTLRRGRRDRRRGRGASSGVE